MHSWNESYLVLGYNIFLYMMLDLVYLYSLKIFVSIFTNVVFLVIDVFVLVSR